MKINVMAPLGLVKFDDQLFKTLINLKQNGVDSISTDLWWNHVEYKKGKYDWRTAQSWSSILKKAGLHWIPILSFHSCGGNVNDNFKSRLPKYVINEFTFFESSKKEKIMDNHFVKDLKNIEKIYTSMGPAGELRYPSYSSTIKWIYPHQGTLTCYDKMAIRSFHKYLEEKYHTIESLNTSWDTDYKKITQCILPESSNQFFSNQSFRNRHNHSSIYGKDVLEWYEHSLHQHFRKMATIMKQTFKNKVKLGVKIAGVHWKYYEDRIAEKATGYVDENYEKIVKLIKDYDFELTITCLEMNNTEKGGIEYILKKISSACKKVNLPAYGENALILPYKHTEGWGNVKKHIQFLNIQGFSYLRLDSIMTDWSIVDKLSQIKKL
jgi:beta-amylase